MTDTRSTHFRAGSSSMRMASRQYSACPPSRGSMGSRLNTPRVRWTKAAVSFPLKQERMQKVTRFTAGPARETRAFCRYPRRLAGSCSTRMPNSPRTIRFGLQSKASRAIRCPISCIREAARHQRENTLGSSVTATATMAGNSRLNRQTTPPMRTSSIQPFRHQGQRIIRRPVEECGDV